MAIGGPPITSCSCRPSPKLSDVEPVLESLYGDMPDDAWDEIEALELLNEWTDGVWLMHDGDLIVEEDRERLLAERDGGE
jgi:hypothetical protein